MSAYVGKFLTAVSSALEFNTATLSGAIDVVVIEDSRGNRHCTPFHVRFGKLQLLKSRGIPVVVHLNGHRTNLRMLLGAAGEAYFYDPSVASSSASTSFASAPSPASPTPQAIAETHDLSVPVRAASQPQPESFYAPTFYNTSPPLASQDSILPETRVATDSPFGYISDSEVELTRNERLGTAEVVDEPRSPPVSGSQRKWSQWAAKGPVRTAVMLDITASVAQPEEDIAGMDDKAQSVTDAGEGMAVVEEAKAVRAHAGAETVNGHTERSIRDDSPAASNAPPAVPGKGTFPASVHKKVPSASQMSGSSAKSTPSLSPDHSDDQYSALFGLPASPVKPSSAKRHKTRPASAPYDAEGDGQRKLRSAERSPAGVGAPADGLNRITVSVDASDIAAEEDNKMECRSLDGYDGDEESPPPPLLERQVSVALEGVEPITVPSRSASSKTKDVVFAYAKDTVEDRPSSPDVECPTSDSPTPIDSKLISTQISDICNDHAEDGASSARYGAEEGIENEASEVSMSLCGGLLQTGMTEDEIMEVFEAHRVVSSDFAENPKILFDPAMLFRIEDRLVELRIAAPFVMSRLAFNTHVNIDWLSRKMAGPSSGDEPKSSRPTSSRRFRWFGWSSPDVEGEPLLNQDDLDALAAVADEEEDTKQPDMSEKNIPKPVDPVSNPSATAEIAISASPEGETAPKTENDEMALALVVVPSEEVGVKSGENEAEISKDEPVVENSTSAAIPLLTFADIDPECLSLRPSHEELAQLDLKPGANTVRFSVESSYAELNCRIFLWSHDSKIVISDVDGTITRSDVLGHLLPAVGRDWSHVGVAGLYSQIEKNGYKMLYLTARPIGQASQTRDFLHNVTQGTARLPNGPVLMSPNRLVESFTREVIRKKPQEFKIAALREVRSLFALDYNPFHAGFGNRETDVISYRAVGLIPHRIFVVNPRGELVVMKAMYESAASYSSLRALLVGSVFPDITGKTGLEKMQALTESVTYNDWNYWKHELPDLDLDALQYGSG